MISRSEPSYKPMARPRSTARGPRRQRAHRAVATLMARHDGSGSPQPSQTGGVMARTACQQDGQTGPAVG
jgi:hypothetical protein